MTEAPRVRRQPYAALGAFIVLLFATMIAAAIVVVRDRDAAGSIVQLRVRNAFGATQGDPVWVSGLRVGKVASVHLDADGTVTVTCLVQESVRVPPDAHVAVTTGLFGDRRVEIVPRSGAVPPDNPVVAYMRSQEGLASNPVDPLAHATAHLFAHAGRLQGESKARSAAVMASAQRLRASLTRLQKQTQLLAARGRPSITMPAIHKPNVRALAQWRGQVRQTIDDAQRARTALVEARGALADPELQRAFAQDEREMTAALAALREALPRR